MSVSMTKAARKSWTDYISRYGETQFQPTAHNAVSRLTYTLPWPPSVNRYWRTPSGASHPIVSEEGRRYRKTVGQIVMANGAKKMAPGRYGVQVKAYPGDNRRRDLDNLLKATLDSLEDAGVWADDAMIDQIGIERVWMAPKRGEIEVTAWTIGL